MGYANFLQHCARISKATKPLNSCHPESAFNVKVVEGDPFGSPEGAADIIPLRWAGCSNMPSIADLKLGASRKKKKV